MKRLYLSTDITLAWLVAETAPASADPGHDGDAHPGFVTDDPADARDGLLGLDGAGCSHVERYLGNMEEMQVLTIGARGVATAGLWSVHGPAVRGSTHCASRYSDGVRVIDLSQPAVPHGDLPLVSDRSFGLSILEHVP